MIIGGDDPGLLESVARTLLDGGIAIIPCDTVYGIVGKVPESEGRIRAVKGRGDDKPFIQLVPDASWIRKTLDATVPASLAKYWPGPLTIVVRRLAGDTVAVRVPDSPFLSALIARVGRAIYSTSVNRAGKPPLQRFSEIRAEFEDEVDLMVDGGDLPGGVPSTIVDATARPPRILRQGGLTVAQRDLS